MTNKIIRIVNILEVVVLILVLSFSTKKIVEHKKEEIETIKVVDEIKEISEETPKKEINKNKNQTKNIIKLVKETSKIDITSLIKKNKDTVGYLKVNNTNINYPVVQSKDNKYYLTHNFNKEKTSAGWIFMDKRNNKNFQNKNNIIYGHSRLDKTMFGTLKNVLEEVWYNNSENHIIEVTTETKTYKYKVFSIYLIDKENYYLQTNFKSDTDYKKFINIIMKRSITNFNIKEENISSILTLSTCYKHTKRVVLHATLIN